MPALAEIGNATFAFREMTSEEAEKNKRVTTMDFVLDYFFAQSVPMTKYATVTKPPKTLGDHVKLLSSATGSGKGSVPFELYLRYWNASHRSIATLEPTVTTAISIPIEIMSNVPKVRAEFRMGKNAGYQTGNFVRKPVSGVVFMTTGVLCQMLRVMTDEQFMRRFQFILIDEAHMRRLDTDIILYLLKSLLVRNLKDPLCPMVIAMSGTMPIKKYARYLDVNEADVINVNVQQFPKGENYPAADVPNYVDDAVRIILDIHKNIGKDDAPERGDIIVFVQSAKPGTEISERVIAENERLDKKILITNVNSDAFRLGTSEYFDTLRPLASSAVADPSGKLHAPQRRLIIGTPAMEAGLTIPSSKYCIDTGYEYSVQYNPVFGCSVEGSKPISRAAAIQRIGRIGRKFPGSFYLTYTKATFDAMEPQPDPDIWTRDIAPMMLNLAVAECMPQTWSKSLSEYESISDQIKSFDATSLDLIDAPSPDGLSAAMEKLFVLGMIDAQSRPTLMGCTAIRFPRSGLESLRMIFEGYIIGANIEDLISMAAILEANPSMLINTNPMRGGRFSPMEIFASSSQDGGAEHQKSTPESSRGPRDWREKQKYVGCDLIELLFVFYEIRERISRLEPSALGKSVAVSNEPSAIAIPSSDQKNDQEKQSAGIAGLRAWMTSVGLMFDQWMTVFGLRDQLLMMFISSGLDPYVNGLGIAQHKYNLVRILRESKTLGVLEIEKLKKCIVAGYRLNTATWSTKSGQYVHDFSGAPLSIKSLTQSHVNSRDATADRPRQLVVFNNALKLPQRSTDGRYAFESSMVSVISGFVEIDDTFATS